MCNKGCGFGLWVAVIDMREMVPASQSVLHNRQMERDGRRNERMRSINKIHNETAASEMITTVEVAEHYHCAEQNFRLPKSKSHRQNNPFSVVNDRSGGIGVQHPADAAADGDEP